jgi:hypothetical protein
MGSRRDTNSSLTRPAVCAAQEFSCRDSCSTDDALHLPTGARREVALNWPPMSWPRGRSSCLAARHGAWRARFAARSVRFPYGIHVQLAYRIAYLGESDVGVAGMPLRAELEVVAAGLIVINSEMAVEREGR